MASVLAHKASCSRSATFARSVRPAGFSTRTALHRIQRPNLVVRAEQAASAAFEVTDATWEKDVIKSDLPVMVDFWAPWCGPCRMIAPLIDELADEYKGKMKFVKLNTDQSPDTATTLGIRSIPTVMIFKGGNRMESVIGAVPKATLKQALEKYL